MLLSQRDERNPQRERLSDKQNECKNSGKEVCLIVVTKVGKNKKEGSLYSEQNTGILLIKVTITL